MALEASPLAQVQMAYQRLTHSELVLFLKVRNLPTIGTDAELASRLSNHDLHTYHFPAELDHASTSSPTLSASQRQSMTPDLPVEILIDIMEHVGDWELAQAVGIPTSLPQPLDWTRATRHLPLIRKAKPSATVAVRFGYVNVLEYFLSQHHKMFLDVFEDDLIPIKASRHGRLNVLSWWKHGFEQHPDLIPPPKRGSVAEAVDRASRNGHVDSLDWWLNCGHQFEYTEAALEYASAKNQMAVLDWWKRQHETRALPLKLGRVMDMASTAGNVDVLEWWARSQLDPNCHGKVEVLQWWLGSGLTLWWDKSGLAIQYRMCDIEEALEESIIPGDAAREWWKKKGVDFNANDKEWMKLQNLN
ncbi:hypothetical protein BJ912DRAFT_1029665 [Pholiota molesta]|nr:hypothetical protein BJ912DRAFT_1029665 [Pholiota molesta]